MTESTARDSPEALLWIGLNHYNQERYQDALPYFTRAIEADPTLAVAWANRGYCNLFLNELDWALHDLDRALALLPPPAGDSDHDALFLVLYSRALALYLLKRYEEASTAFIAAASLSPLPVDGLLAQADTYRFTGRAERAGAVYGQILNDVEPEKVSTETRLRVARGLMELGDFATALAATWPITEREPWNALGWAINAQALFALARHEESLTSVERALALDAQDDAMWGVRGAALRHLKRYTEAQAAYHTAYTLALRNPEGRATAFQGELRTLLRLTRWRDAWRLVNAEVGLRLRERRTRRER
jgi:tetratricopeptide (TPR) repeat protein